GPPAAAGGGQDLPGGAAVLRAGDRAPVPGQPVGRVRRRGRRGGQGRVPGERLRPAVPDRLGRAVRAGDDRGDGLRHPGGGVPPRGGPRGDGRRGDRVRGGRRARGGWN